MSDHHRRSSEGDLRAELRWVAAEHEPDRTAMLNRIAANRGLSRSSRAQTLRLAGSALAVTSVLGLGGVASWALAAEKAPPVTQPLPPVVVGAESPSPWPSSPSPPEPSQSSPSSSSPTRHSPSAKPPRSSAPASAPDVRGHPGDTQVEKGSLWSDGSVADGRSTVTLEAGAEVTELELTIRVTKTPGLTDQGATDDVSAAGIATTVEHQSGALVYHFILAEGDTLPAGTYHFLAHYHHGGAGRDAGDDTYEAYGTDVERKRLHVYGNFFAASSSK